MELLGEVHAFDLVDLLEVLDGAFEQLLEQLNLGVRQFDLLDLGEVVVSEDVDFSRFAGHLKSSRQPWHLPGPAVEPISRRGA